MVNNEIFFKLKIDLIFFQINPVEWVIFSENPVKEDKGLLEAIYMSYMCLEDNSLLQRPMFEKGGFEEVKKLEF